MNEREAKALYRAANVFDVVWLMERLDAHLMNKNANNDVTEALFIASSCNRNVICVGSLTLLA